MKTQSGSRALCPLVEERLCTCAQTQLIESVYRWNAAVVDEPEYRLLLKSTDGGCEALEARLAELNPYEIPTAVRINADASLAKFADWVRAEVRPPVRSQNAYS